ncbi:D-amino acid dehydrogenase [Phenylobacterium sp.]|uniref:D-amino acid dehydrogenase n=1 Tax=Phenylobacterium sp. TaxID=1871053 RepID=UPI0039C8D540
MIVLGAGVIGVTTAYYLAKAGRAVTVVDRQPGPGMETSFANAGEISPGYASPWASPDVPKKAPRWLLMEHAPLIFHPKADPAMWVWLLRMLRNCTPARYAQNKERMVRLAEYSREKLIDLRGKTGIAYDHRSLGTLQVFRTQSQLDGVAKDIEVLAAGGVPYQLLDQMGCLEVEPGLAYARDEIVGGLRLPNDETGDCYAFTTALAACAAELGVDFQYGVRAAHLEIDRGRVARVHTDAGPFEGAAFVVAMGSYSTGLLRGLGLQLPVYPVKGYSITAPIADYARAPESTLLDETFKIAITRLGDRIRVGGMAEISGFSAELDPRRRRTLEYSLESLFPGAADTKASTYWTGLRPMTPDGTPVVGPTPLPNLYLNTGHGTLGWTMACGSAHLIADLVCGHEPDIRFDDLGLSRYQQPFSRRAASRTPRSPSGAGPEADLPNVSYDSAADAPETTRA